MDHFHLHPRSGLRTETRGSASRFLYGDNTPHGHTQAFLPLSLLSRKRDGQSGPNSSAFVMSGRRNGRTAWL